MLSRTTKLKLTIQFQMANSIQTKGCEMNLPTFWGIHVLSSTSSSLILESKKEKGHKFCSTSILHIHICTLSTRWAKTFFIKELIQSFGIKFETSNNHHCYFSTGHWYSPENIEADTIVNAAPSFHTISINKLIQTSGIEIETPNNQQR